MTGLRKTALAAITVLVAAASVTSFAESYRALYDWASHHGVHGLWAAAWPLQVDTFIGVGELALFVALADQWQVRSRAAAWTVTALGLAVSVAGNIGHTGTHDWTSRATAAVPPLAAAAALAVGLGVLKRVVAKRPTAARNLPAEKVSPRTRTRTRSAPVRRTPAAPVTDTDAASQFMDELATGAVPSIRQIRTRLHLGQDRATQVQTYLRSITAPGRETQ